MPRYFLGVDGGQSSTTALIGDETGQVLGFGRGGPCNHVGAAEGRQKFLSAVGGALRLACESARIGGRPAFEAACLGFSGGPADKEPLIAGLMDIGHRVVTNDALIALAGAHAGGPGIITIAGTGSIAFGRNILGRQMRAGGWGYIYGDEGGGFDLTRQALRAALRMEEGWGPETVLRARLLEATGARNANELLHRFYTTEFTRPAIAALSQHVDTAAAAGDAVALDILRASAQQLAGIAGSVRKQLFGASDAVRVAYIGGVWRSQPLLERFRSILEADGRTTVAAPLHGPAAGALLEAYRAAGLLVTLSGLPEAEK
jgi:N-acetylglucosamine kinase-like BadF-type ATPase